MSAQRWWTFSANLAVKGQHFRLTLPLNEPLFINSVHYMEHNYIVLEGTTSRVSEAQRYSFISLDGTTEKSKYSDTRKEKERSQAETQASPILF